MDNIYIDSDIILDLLGKREPFFPHAAKLFSLVDSGEITAYVSPLIFSNIYYILRKLLSKEKAIKGLHKLKLLVKVLPIDDKIIELALVSEFNDFEDAIHYYTAKENGIYYLITRNKKDYKKTDLIVCTAEEYLRIREGKKDNTGSDVGSK
ncbi:MAG: type II toxin-antitoxin system VapC family toxin [bacterium]